MNKIKKQKSFLSAVFGGRKYKNTKKIPEPAVKSEDENSVKSVSRPLTFKTAPDMIFSSGQIWNKVAQEYCLANDKDINSLGEYDKRKIFEYSCTPISYLFLWAARRGYLSPRLTNRVNIASLLIENSNPALFIVNNMDSMVCLGDFSEEVHRFIKEYYILNSGETDDEGRKFEYDYYIQIRNPWKIFYCIDYTPDFYDKLEEKIDSAFRYCQSRADWENPALHESTGYEELKMSETFGHRLEVKKSEGVTAAYAEKCTRQVSNMPLGLLDKLCDSLIEFAGRCGNKTEKYMLDKTSILSELYSGRIIIPAPMSYDTAYVLQFESDFETEHGTGIVIRDGVIVNVTYADETGSPWMFRNDLTYRIKQCLALTDISSIDTLGKALHEYSEGTVEQSIIIPYFTGNSVPDENRLFVPEPVAALKSRNDNIAEKLMTEGLADRYECNPEFKGDSFIPCELSLYLWRGQTKVFSSEVSIW